MTGIFFSWDSFEYRHGIFLSKSSREYYFGEQVLHIFTKHIYYNFLLLFLCHIFNFLPSIFFWRGCHPICNPHPFYLCVHMGTLLVNIFYRTNKFTFIIYDNIFQVGRKVSSSGESVDIVGSIWGRSTNRRRGVLGILIFVIGICGIRNRKVPSIVLLRGDFEGKR